MKHTPGPWFSGHKCEMSGWINIYSIEHDGHSLPFAACKHQDVEANARLIAAAPELLDALKALTHSLEFDDLLHDDQRKAFNAALAAIAKAEGVA